MTSKRKEELEKELKNLEAEVSLLESKMLALPNSSGFSQWINDINNKEQRIENIKAEFADKLTLAEKQAHSRAIMHQKLI